MHSAPPAEPGGGGEEEERARWDHVTTAQGEHEAVGRRRGAARGAASRYLYAVARHPPEGPGS